MNLRLLFLSSILVFSCTLFSQDSLPKNNFSPSFDLFVGYLPKTYPIAPKSNYVSMASINFMWQLNGKDVWHQYYHYPKGGVTLFAGTFNNPEELGHVLGFVPGLELNGKNPDKKWSVKIGLGVAYFNKPFDPVTNPKNYYIGSHLANMTAFSFIRENRITKTLLVNYGVALIHCSNGHVTLPNVGMNMLMITSGIRFGKTSAKTFQELNPKKGQLSYAFKLGIGMHQFGATEKAVGGPTYASYHVSAWVSKPYRNIHLFQLGFTAAYYRSFYAYITSQQLDYKNPHVYSGTGLVFIGHEFVFGKFSLSTRAGFYVFNPFFIKQKKIEGTWKDPFEKVEAFNTNRLGLLYYPFKKKNTLNKVKNQLMLGVFIKANLAQADLIEYSVGYVF